MSGRTRPQRRQNLLLDFFMNGSGTCDETTLLSMTFTQTVTVRWKQWKTTTAWNPADVAEQPLWVPDIQSAAQDCKKPLGTPGN